MYTVLNHTWCDSAAVDNPPNIQTLNPIEPVCIIVSNLILLDNGNRARDLDAFLDEVDGPDCVKALPSPPSCCFPSSS